MIIMIMIMIIMTMSKMIMFELFVQDLNCTGRVGPENQKFNFLLDKLEPETRYFFIDGD